MWSGWLSAAAAAAFLTLLLAAEKVIDESTETWSWASIFVPVWLLIAAFYVSSLSPCLRNRAAFSNPEASRYAPEVIQSARTDLRRGVWQTVVSLLLTTLTLVFFILLALRLDGVLAAWTAPLAVLIASLSGMFLYALVTYIYVLNVSPDPAWTHGTALLACCVPPPDTNPHPYDADVPVCLGGYDMVTTWEVLYNGLLIGGLALLVAWAALLFPFTAGTITLSVLFIPLWIAIGILGLATAYGSVRECSSAAGDCYTGATLVLFLINLLALLTTTLLLIYSPLAHLHTTFLPLYIILGLDTIIFCALQYQHRYRHHTTPDSQPLTTLSWN